MHILKIAAHCYLSYVKLILMYNLSYDKFADFVPV